MEKRKIDLLLSLVKLPEGYSLKRFPGEYALYFSRRWLDGDITTLIELFSLDATAHDVESVANVDFIDHVLVGAITSSNKQAKT